MHTKKERDKQNKKKKYNLVINKWSSQNCQRSSVDFSQCEAVINPCYPVTMDHCNLESYYTWYHSLCRWHCHILLCLPNSWDKVGFKSTWLLFFLILETHFVILNFVFFFFFFHQPIWTTSSSQHTEQPWNYGESRRLWDVSSGLRSQNQLYFHFNLLFSCFVHPHKLGLC